MKVVLINPSLRSSYWTFSEAQLILPSPGFITNLALPTLAALTPEYVDLAVIDEVVTPIDFDVDCDVVGITGYNTQASRMFEIAAEFRRRGRLVVIGGPYASLSPSTVRPHADVLVTGEAEQTWPQFLRDYQDGTWKDHYDAGGPVDYASSPPPRFDVLSSQSYLVGAVQTSRGCPFSCEYCDVIVYLGRRQRHKEPEQVVKEISNLHDAGYRQVFLADDNFTANRRRSAAILQAISAWNDGNAERMSFSTQLSIDVANDRDEPLLDLCVSAGLNVAFVGIETPSLDALRDVKKKQNTHRDLIESVRRIHRHGILVQAGMIVGFDTDTIDCFEAEYEFLREAGLPIASVGMLNAPEGTPLEQRLLAAGRLQVDPVDDGYLSTNIVPLRMTSDELEQGTFWLLNRLYSPTAFLERVERCAADLPVTPRGPALCTGAAIDRLRRMRHAYRDLGPEFERLPEQMARLLRDRDQNHLTHVLLFYFNVVRMLQRWGVWNPAMATLPTPFPTARSTPVSIS
jgi:radical SAM superfamily enzyme YgiQ (UPF0313 family)